MSQYANPDWAVKQVRRMSGLIEDLCEHGVGHPNREWMDQNDPDGTRYFGVHGCCGCCRVTAHTEDSTATSKEQQ